MKYGVSSIKVIRMPVKHENSVRYRGYTQILKSNKLIRWAAKSGNGGASPSLRAKTKTNEKVI